MTSDEDELYGLLQFSCGLPTPILANHGKRPVSRAVTVGDLRERRQNLESWLLPPGGTFQLHGLTDIFADRVVQPPHTWLLHLSRHAAVELRDYSSRQAGQPVPDGFPPALDWHRPAEDDGPGWTHYLRVQRARDDANRFTAEIDCNDYLVRPPELADANSALKPGSLWELQLFLCEFLAQRRGAIFASHVSERIYSIWLPPAVITRDGERDRSSGRGCFAVLPVVTVVRRPYGIDWRYAMSVTALFVPWAGGAPGELALCPRPMSPEEIYQVVASTGGNSTYLRGPAELRWVLHEESPLRTYLEAVTGDDRRGFCYQYGRTGERGGWDSQALRHWIELLLMTVAEIPAGSGERDDGPLLPEQHPADDRILSDEVLRCLRVNGIWSAMLVTESFPACTENSALADDRWWSELAQPRPATVGDLTAGLPASVRAVFELFARRARGFAPAPGDRIDVLSSGGLAHVTWRIPRENIMVTVYDLSADDFPSFSSLYLVGWFAYMAVGVTCAWQTMYSLTHDTDRLRDVAEISQLGHDRIMDLEDVYEFDVAWPAYAEFYRRLRELLGVDREYAEITGRLDLLFRFAQVEQRTREERLRDEEIRLDSVEQRIALTRVHTVENVAAVVGSLILLVSILNLLADLDQGSLVTLRGIITLAIIICGGVAVLSWLRSRIHKIDRERENARAELARLAQPDGSGAGRERPAG